MLFIDWAAKPDTYYTGGNPPWDLMRFRHGGGKSINLAFLDGHAETWNYKGLGTGSPATAAYQQNLLGYCNTYLPWNTCNVP